MAWAPSLAMNSWERDAFNHMFPDDSIPSIDGDAGPGGHWRQLQDPNIYPGIYSASGFDVMEVLFRTISRPNPRIELGPVDCSVAIVVCDLDQPDQPIVYASESFCDLTGYSAHEVIGQNCRFLQQPGRATSGGPVKPADKAAIHQLGQAVHGLQEVQLRLTNYRKSGDAFTNVLSMIPLKFGVPEHQYAVGFLAEV